MHRRDIKATFNGLDREMFGSKTFKARVSLPVCCLLPLSVHMISRGFFSQVPEYFWTLPAIAAGTWGSECCSSTHCVHRRHASL